MPKEKYDIEKMKKLRAEGLSYYKIALKVGAHPSTVAACLNPKIKKKMREASKRWHKKSGSKRKQADRFKARYKEDKNFRKRHLDYCKKRQKERQEQLSKLKKDQHRVRGKRKKILKEHKEKEKKKENKNEKKK